MAEQHNPQANAPGEGDWVHPALAGLIEGMNKTEAKERLEDFGRWLQPPYEVDRSRAAEACIAAVQGHCDGLGIDLNVAVEAFQAGIAPPVPSATPGPGAGTTGPPQPRQPGPPAEDAPAAEGVVTVRLDVRESQRVAIHNLLRSALSRFGAFAEARPGLYHVRTPDMGGAHTAAVQALATWGMPRPERFVSGGG